jgi:hypothetical protein
MRRSASIATILLLLMLIPAPVVALIDEAQPADEGTGEETPWWVLLVTVGGVIVLVGTVAFGGRGKELRVAAPDPGWKPKARSAYAEARWLSDAMTEDLAVWRGNAQFDGTTAPGSSAQSAAAETWQALAGRMDRARDALYGLEAAAPNARTAQTARAVAAGLLRARSALDARAEARFHYRTVDDTSGDEGVPRNAVAEARDRELRSAQNLAADNDALAELVVRLSVLT